MATPQPPKANGGQDAPKMKEVTKTGTSLDTLQEVTLYKQVAHVPEIKDMKEALARVNNDQTKLLKMIRDGLQEEAVNVARNDENGWKVVDENGNQTDQTFSGALISRAILNPAVLAMCKIMTFPIQRNGKEIEISWDEALDGTDEKGKLKEQALATIRENKKMVESLKRKQQALDKEQSK